jgi:NAD+ synthase (glutamine-hydrolysing)
MKIALAQLNYHIGNFDYNLEKIKSAIANAKTAGADLVVFSELAICGYPPLDYLEFYDFIIKCKKAIDEITIVSNGIAIIIGAPSENNAIEGKDLFNSAYFIAEGKVQSVHHKGLLPNYDVFDEYRYFEPELSFEVLEFKGRRIALTICEDLWNIDEENKLYRLTPMEELIKQHPDLMINIAASPFSFQHPCERLHLLKRNVEKYNLPLFYVNQTGAHTELIFDGGSLAFNNKGEVIAASPQFTEDLLIVDLENDPPKNLNPYSFSKIHMINEALVVGVKDYFWKMGFKKAVLGLSGGIDSAVVLCIAAAALGKENVHAVLLPSMYSSDHSVNDALELIKNLGCSHDIIPIKDVYNTFLSTLEPVFKNLPHDLAEENIQARARGMILMALSNKFGYILLNTSNKSEMAVGYGTLYGDMCGGIAVIGDLYKTEVYELSRFLNREREIIPENTITKPPSAELRLDQKDSDSLPEYNILDKILFEFIENRRGEREIVQLGFEPSVVKRVLKLIDNSEWKRKQAPPVLRLSDKAFGLGRRIPIVGKF